MTPEHTDAQGVEEKREPGLSKPWLDMIVEAERYFREYQDKCDKIEKMYAEMKTASEVTTDREFQIFWANLEVLKPTIYSRPPVPVVVPRFQNRKPVPTRASELLERAAVSAFETGNLDEVMVCVRDDMATIGRGVPWLRYEVTPGEGDEIASERVVIEHVDRTDYLEEPARKYADSGWKAKRSWMTRKEGLARFEKTSGQAFINAEFAEKETDKADDYRGEKKAPVWEIWHRKENKVIWVAPGVDVILDEGEPHLKLEDFFPCPKPAYGTLQPRTLIPVPDYVQYQDQLDEINEFTARISALSESLRMKGFYQKGGEDVGDALERILEDNDNRATLVPVSSVAALGTGNLKDAIVWWPVSEVAAVIRELVDLRRQMIEDVYQITGLSDIMRGETDPNETLGAQQIKSQYGAIRVRDKQKELVRVARDITRIACEIMAENFREETLLTMAQIDDIPREEEIQAKIAGIVQRAQQAAASPQASQMQPQQLQQVKQQVQSRIEKLEESATVEKVFTLIREQRLRPFALDIETDSTIQPDEDAEKQRRTEFVQVIGGFVRDSMPVVEQFPAFAELAGETLKFLAAPFRAGRELDSVIEDMVDKLKAMPPKPREDKQQGPAGNPESDRVKAAVEMQKANIDLEKVKIEQQQQAEKHQMELAELRASLEKIAMELQGKQMDMAGKVEDRKRAQLDAMAAEAEKQAAQANGQQGISQ